MDITRPFDILNGAMNKQVLIRLKGNRQLRGKLSAFDQHMNLVLGEAEELEETVVKAKIGTVLVRGDNIIYVSP